MRDTLRILAVCAMLSIFGVGPLCAQDMPGAPPNGEAQGADAAELAKKLANPVAALISVPFQYNYDRRIGPDGNGRRSTLNIQPVIPVPLNDKWNMISRTILPVVDQTNIFSGAGNQTGIGDITQSLFFSPRQPAAGGWIWGAGPVFLIPTGSDKLLGTGKWGIGPTAVVLRQSGPWIYGIMGNHIWSFAGDGDRSNVSNTFLQPFLSYNTKNAWTFTLNSESTYDWVADEWSVPIHFMASKVTKIGGQMLSLGGGVSYWASAPESGPGEWGFRMVVTLLYPEKR